MKALYFDNDLKKILAVKAASVFWKFAALSPLSPVQYGNIPEPELPNERWLKVKNKSCGLCGTDIHFMFMELDPKCFPAALPGIDRKFLGHEVIGEVTQTGADAGDFAPGDRVCLRIEWPSCFQLEIDPPCPSCAKGNYMLCENIGTAALPLRDTGAGFSPIMVVHRSQPFKIPDALEDARAVLLEPTASSLHGVMKRPPTPGDKVLVIGAGTIGLLCVANAKALCPDAEIHILARHPFQGEAAKKMGADNVLMDTKNIYGELAEATGARHIKALLGNEILLGGYDVIYDSVGNDTTITNALRFVRAGGDVVLLGINFMPGKIDYTPIWNQEIHVTGINCHATETTGENSFEMAARLLIEKKIPVDALVTHRFKMANYKDAVKTFLNKGRTEAIKIVLDHESK
jgi:threonine dehydrogenase-like Zn-dependent dehydrogenase